jgi:FkbM family methyltransferase
MIKQLVWKHHARKTLQRISQLLEDQTLALIDVGAAGGIEPRWKQITSKLDYVGFEPDDRSNAEDLVRGQDYVSYTLLPFALWSENCLLEINLCRKPGVSSHFLPDINFTQRFPRSDRFDVVGEVEVRAVRLDSVDIKQCDFIKLDIQGGELAVLQGAEKLLPGVFGLEIEVEFLPIYKTQPLFGDICTFLAEHDLEFVDFTNLCCWNRRQRRIFGQCVFGDALFLKSPERIKQYFDESKIMLSDVRRYIAILALYRRADLMHRCLELFGDLLNEDQKLIADVNSAVAEINEDLSKLRIMATISRFLFRLIGNHTRSHITY